MIRSNHQGILNEASNGLNGICEVISENRSVLPVAMTSFSALWLETFIKEIGKFVAIC